MVKKVAAGSDGCGPVLFGSIRLFIVLPFQLALLAVLLGSPLNAQATGGAPSQSSAMSSQALQAYGLSAITLSSEQKGQFDALIKAYAHQYKAFAATMNAKLRAARRSANEAELAQARAIKDSHLAEIRKILTHTQQTRFDANVKEMKEQAELNRSEMLANRNKVIPQPAPETNSIPVLVPYPDRPRETGGKRRSPADGAKDTTKKEAQ